MDSGEPKMYETAPEPIDSSVYDNLTEEQQDAMNDLLARNPNMDRSEALKIVSGSKEEKEEA